MTDDDDLRALLPFLATPERHEHTHSHRTDVTVKRAPTDESVRLLKEMEKAAQDKLIEAVRVEHNAFKCVVQEGISHVDDTVTLLAVFELNGRRMTAQHNATRRADTRSRWLALRDAVAKEIATSAIEEAFRAVRR